MPSMNVKPLSQHLKTHMGAVNVGILQSDRDALLIDFGAGEVLEDAKFLGIERLEKVLFTHHHRDQVCGIHLLGVGSVRIGVPEAERKWFEDVASYWNDPSHRWHIYNFHPHHLMLVDTVPVHETYREGDVIEWGEVRIAVISTPGHTDGSVSYLVDADGQRVAFCGDLVHEGGRLLDLYSLQKGNATTDYHGFLGARSQLVRSLRKIIEARPSVLVPSHGSLIFDPDRAIDTLISRLRSCYDRYASISALRFYFPELFEEYANNPNVMPIRSSKPVPEFLHHFKTTWILTSQDGAAFVIDCGESSVIEEVKKLHASGMVGRIEGLWITHYHDDHVDAAPEFRKTFNCQIMADSHVAEVIENPLAWRLPCISPVKLQVDRRTKDGEAWRWHEFEMRAYRFPGQTLYHGGLFVEGRGLRMFFAGDSFTPAGIDDYCCGNRNFLRGGDGFDLCVSLLENLKPDLIFNNHVDRPFDFTPEQYAFMRKNLEEREREYGELIAWDDPNYGMDEHWVRCFPYEQHVMGGANITLQVVFTNHSSTPQEVVCRAVPPRSWGLCTTHSKHVKIQPRQEGSVSISLKVPEKNASRRYVVPIDVWYADRFLPQFTEAIVKVGS